MNMPDQNRPDGSGPDNAVDTEHDRPLEQRARELYHEAARRIDPATIAQLRIARREAMQRARSPVHHGVRWLIPTGAFAVIALAAMMVWQPLPTRHAPVAAPLQAVNDTSADLDNELPPDADKTDPNLYQNLDFYGWLAANDIRPTNR